MSVPLIFYLFITGIAVFIIVLSCVTFYCCWKRCISDMDVVKMEVNNTSNRELKSLHSKKPKNANEYRRRQRLPSSGMQHTYHPPSPSLLILISLNKCFSLFVQTISIEKKSVNLSVIVDVNDDAPFSHCKRSKSADSNHHTYTAEHKQQLSLATDQPSIHLKTNQPTRISPSLSHNSPLVYVYKSHIKAISLTADFMLDDTKVGSITKEISDEKQLSKHMTNQISKHMTDVLSVKNKPVNKLHRSITPRGMNVHNMYDHRTVQKQKRKSKQIERPSVHKYSMSVMDGSKQHGFRKRTYTEDMHQIICKLGVEKRASLPPMMHDNNIKLSPILISLANQRSLLVLFLV